MSTVLLMSSFVDFIVEIHDETDGKDTEFSLL